MDLSGYLLEELLANAIKSEIEAKELYEGLSEKVKNFFLKEKLKFLAQEEQRHRETFESIFNKRFPGKKINLPEKSTVPLPNIVITSERIKISKVFEMAMEAEKAAYDFYIALASQFKDEPEVEQMINYIASMEMGHYKIFEIERENALKFEDYDIENPLIHLGP
ncbi:MAG: ferritin family protein [Candidatus Hydrothermales bacterium]